MIIVTLYYFDCYIDIDTFHYCFYLLDPEAGNRRSGFQKISYPTMNPAIQNIAWLKTKALISPGPGHMPDIPHPSPKSAAPKTNLKSTSLFVGTENFEQNIGVFIFLKMY